MEFIPLLLLAIGSCNGCDEVEEFKGFVLEYC